MNLSSVQNKMENDVDKADTTKNKSNKFGVKTTTNINQSTSKGE